MSAWLKDTVKVKCKTCGFDFFTQYQERVDLAICSTCDPTNENTKTVKDWEK